MTDRGRVTEGTDLFAIPGHSGIPARAWFARHERLERKIRQRIARVEREREQLRRELHALNYHLIQGISPASRREDWDSRLRVMKRFLDPTLYRVERMTGWRFGYEAESRNEHHWPVHRSPGP